MSNYTGDIEVTLKDKKLTICYDWSALSCIASLDYDDPIAELNKPVTKVKAEVVADILACGLKKHHPDMDRDYIMAWSPPMLRVMMVIDKALTIAYHGNDKPEAVKKKTSQKRTMWQRLFG